MRPVNELLGDVRYFEPPDERGIKHPRRMTLKAMARAFGEPPWEMELDDREFAQIPRGCEDTVGAIRWRGRRYVLEGPADE